MTLFLYVVSITYHTSVPVLRKCMDTSRKKVFWLRAQPLMHCLLHLFVRPESLASHHLFELSKDMKVRGRVRRMWKTLEGQIFYCCNSWNGQYGAEHCHVATKHLYSEVRVIWTWLQVADNSLGDLHTLHCSQCCSWACSTPRLPLVHPKRESA